MKEQTKKLIEELHNQPANTTAPEARANKVAVPKKLDAPAEALLGVVNGALVGGLLTTVGSFAYTATQKHAFGNTNAHYFGDIKNNYLGVVLGGTAAIGLINALVRVSHALKHNTWVDTVNEKTGHLERLETERTKASLPQKS